IADVSEAQVPAGVQFGRLGVAPYILEVGVNKRLHIDTHGRGHRSRQRVGPRTVARLRLPYSVLVPPAPPKRGTSAITGRVPFSAVNIAALSGTGCARHCGPGYSSR